MSRKVLIVDDEAELLTLMGDAFRKADIEVYLASNGETGLELFHSVQPDLVITDIVMPAKEGVSLIIDIKRSLFDVPVIAISGGGARGCKDYLRWARELGADLVLQKPFRMSVLLMMSRFLMEKSAMAVTPRPADPHPETTYPELADLDLAELFDDRDGLGPAAKAPLTQRQH
jgi:DNA-binding response OmpR family regulator